MGGIVVHDIIKVVSVEVADERLTVRFDFERKGARLEHVIMLARLAFNLRHHPVNKFDDRARSARAGDEESEDLACAADGDAVNLLAITHDEVLPGLEHLCRFRVLVHKDLISTIYGDQVCVAIAVHICEHLQVPKVAQLARPDVHLVEPVGRRQLEELSSERRHVDQLLATRLCASRLAVAKIEVFLLPLVLQQLLLVLLLVQGSLFLLCSIDGCGVLRGCTRTVRCCCSSRPRCQDG